MDKRGTALVVLMLILGGCTQASSETVRLLGDDGDARLTLRYIRAAERGDARSFAAMTRRSADPTFGILKMDAVDRRDEGCELASIHASTRMVSALWKCPDDSKRNVQRSFLIEASHVTTMWNDRADRIF